MKHKDIESCVFYFFNETTEKQKKSNKIHKIVKKDFFIINELTNQLKLKNIQNNTHFYLCNNNSELKLVEIQDNTHKIKSKGAPSDNTILLEFEDKNLIYLKNYLKTLFLPQRYIYTIINFYEHLLSSLNMLAINNIFHNHVVFESIVVDKSHYPLITNFSFSIDLLRPDMDEYIKHFIVAYEPSYIEWPLELHILSYLLTNKLNSLSSYNIELIINEVIQHNSILNTFGSSVVSSFKEDAMHHFKKYVNQSYEFILTDMLQYSHTWDNYALSILFLRILIGIHRTIGIKNKFIILFMKLLVNNIHLNPFKRLTIDKTRNNFNNLLDSLEPKDYKDVIKGLTI